jgi:hypothetical protein
MNDRFLEETTHPDATGWIGNSMTAMYRLAGS